MSKFRSSHGRPSSKPAFCPLSRTHPQLPCVPACGSCCSSSALWPPNYPGMYIQWRSCRWTSWWRQLVVLHNVTSVETMMWLVHFGRQSIYNGALHARLNFLHAIAGNVQIIPHVFLPSFPQDQPRHVPRPIQPVAHLNELTTAQLQHTKPGTYIKVHV